jgi:microcystin-dependent protein
MDPFLGEIRLFCGNFAPRGWAFCDGTLLALAANTALFSLLGTQYGGNGQTNFALPDLRGRVPVHQGTLQGATYVMGQVAGVENVTLLSSQIPSHTHLMSASTETPSAVGSGINLTGSTVYVPSSVPKPQCYAPDGSPLAAMYAQAVSQTGGNQPHNNMAPFLALNFIIALEGVFPSRS